MKWRKAQPQNAAQPPDASGPGRSGGTTIQDLYASAPAPVLDAVNSGAASLTDWYAGRWPHVDERQRTELTAGLILYGLRGWWLGREDRRAAGWQPPAGVPEFAPLFGHTKEIFDAKAFELGRPFLATLEEFQQRAVFEEVLPTLVLGQHGSTPGSLSLTGTSSTVSSLPELTSVAGDRRDVQDAIRAGSDSVLWGLAVSQAEVRCDAVAAHAAARGQANYAAGMAHFGRGGFAEALALLPAALDDFRRAGRPADQAEVLYEMSGASQQLGRRADAVQFARQCLAAFEQTSTGADQVKALTRLGTALSELDEDEEAIVCFRRGIELARLVGDRSAEAVLLGKTSAALRWVGREAEAYDVAGAALSAFRAIGDRLNEGLTLNRLGLLDETRSPLLAIQHFEQAYSAFTELGREEESCSALHSVAGIYAGQGQLDKSVEYYEAAAAAAHRGGLSSVEAVVLVNLAEHLHDAGRDSQAQEALARAGQAAVAAEDVAMATTVGTLAQLWGDRGTG